MLELRGEAHADFERVGHCGESVVDRNRAAVVGVPTIVWRLLKFKRRVTKAKFFRQGYERSRFGQGELRRGPRSLA